MTWRHLPEVHEMHQGEKHANTLYVPPDRYTTVSYAEYNQHYLP